MKAILVLIGILILIAGCNHTKEKHTTELIDSIKYLHVQKALLTKSLDDAHFVIDKMLEQPNTIRSQKKARASVAERLKDIHAYIKERDTQLKDLEAGLEKYKSQAEAYEMMSVALQDELQFRDEVLMTLTDSVDGLQEISVINPTASQPKKVYINFPE